jgi:hypothetical protein
MADGVKEVIQFCFAIFQSAKLRNQLRNFWKKSEVIRRSIIPFLNRFYGKNPVVESVHFYGVKLGRVVGKFVFGSFWVKTF